MTQRGLTLIETVIYIALLSFIMGGVLAATFQLLQSSAALDSQTTIQEEGDFVLHKLGWALTGTSTLEQVMTPSAAVPYSDTLSLVRADGTQVEVQLNPATHAIEMREGGVVGTYTPLTTSNVKVSQLQFHYLGGAGAPAGIEASTTINGVEFYLKKYFPE